MAENRATTKKIEEYLSRIVTLEEEFKTLKISTEKSLIEIQQQFAQTLAGQREEIAHLRQELIRERQDRRRRRIKAKGQFESE